MKKEKVMVDWLDYDYFYVIKGIKKVEKKTKYQKLKIVENKMFGNMLVLDSCFQTSENDEYLYHEPMAHVPLLTHPNPERVLIIGGGDGGTLKQVLKHKGIKKVDMVEIDGDVVKFSKKYLKKIHEDSFNHKKANIIIDNGIKYLEETKEMYDVIILDLTDPGGISLDLYTNKFYNMVKSKLNKNGILCLHTDTPYMIEEVHIRILKTLMNSFKIVNPFYSYIPLYGTILGFAVCSDKYDAKKLNVKEVEKRIKERKITKLKMLDGEVFVSMLVVPKKVRENLKSKKYKIINKKDNLKNYEELNKATGKIVNLFSKS